MPLNVLNEDETYALLAQRLGERRIAAEPVAVAELIGACGRYPLALAIMAGRAHARPHIPLAELASELGDLGLDALADSDPAASLPTVLSWSLRGLTAEQRTVFGLLGIAPGADIGLLAAASLTNLGLPETRIVLRELEEASLLHSQSGGRYMMHDLIRDFAARLELPEDNREAAMRRVLDFYLHTAYSADRLLTPHRVVVPIDPPAPGVHHQPLPDTPSAMTWFDCEHANLLAAQHDAGARGQHQAVWLLAWTLNTFQGRRADHHSELVAWQAAVASAAHLPDPANRIRAYRQLGRAYRLVNRKDEAIRHLHQAPALAERHDDATIRANIHQSLGLVWNDLGDVPQALDHARQALDLFRASDQPTWQAQGHTLVGWCLALLGDHHPARAHCQAALELSGDRADIQASNQHSLGYIAHAVDDHREAVDRYRQSLALFRTLDDAYEIADTLEHLGHPHAALGEHEQARAAWREALDLYQRQDRDEEAERVRQLLT